MWSTFFRSKRVDLPPSLFLLNVSGTPENHQARTPRQRRKGRQPAARRAPPAVAKLRTGGDKEGKTAPSAAEQPSPSSAPPHRTASHVDAAQLARCGRSRIRPNTSQHRRRRNGAIGGGDGVGERGNISRSRRKLGGARSPRRYQRRPAQGQWLASQAAPLGARC